ncbi:PLD nuclease N-terminal domain-containing protein [Microbacterium sp. UBA1612]|jgi:cytoskeletal protein RodZ|uniref:PLD nuclease N-terminal domain-containing protein n=1 Tax=Microbacterium sp. UBA1612 TaxID=1946942 RepID=UPI00257A374A|nr:PLD nuclease N-terminal domain-containing protein [Microbacterium sp. UBA1612]|tara:strand:+ start:52227 stop:52736 length:510 start_codon:yes stop_codon:yes gene_type:complete
MEGVTRVLLIVALIAVAFWVFTIVDCAVQPKTRHRGVSKPLWLVIVIVIPVLGGLMWLIVGRRPRPAPAAPLAPDDDPQFTGTFGSIRDQDERIRRLEEELAMLDAESDWDPPVPDKPVADAGGSTGEATAEEPSAADATAAGEQRSSGEQATGSRPDDDERGQRGAVG